MTVSQYVERLVWTVVAAFLGALTVSDLIGISTLQSGISAAASAGVNFLLLVARDRLAILPDPGTGLLGRDDP